MVSFHSFSQPCSLVLWGFDGSHGGSHAWDWPPQVSDWTILSPPLFVSSHYYLRDSFIQHSPPPFLSQLQQPSLGEFSFSHLASVCTSSVCSTYKLSTRMISQGAERKNPLSCHLIGSVRACFPFLTHILLFYFLVTRTQSQCLSQQRGDTQEPRASCGRDDAECC